MMKKINFNKPSRYELEQSGTRLASSLIRYAFLIAIAYVVIVQLVYILSFALRSPDEVYDASIVWVQKTFTLQNFKTAFKALYYMKTVSTTLGIQVLSGLIEVFTCSVAAYGFARFNFRGKNAMFVIVLIMILVPPQMTAVSMSLNYAHFDFFGILNLLGNIFEKELRPNLLNTGFVFWLPSAFGVGLRSGLFIFIYRQFFKGLPKELEEAASIDGANAFTTFSRVVLPSSGVAFLTVAIFSVVWHWNDYYLSVLYFVEDFPLSVSLAQLGNSMYLMGGAFNSSLAVNMAACTLYILPVLIMYFILQRKFISSIDRVGIVG